jgi:hypothetical protein
MRARGTAFHSSQLSDQQNKLKDYRTPHKIGEISSTEMPKKVKRYMKNIDIQPSSNSLKEDMSYNYREAIFPSPRSLNASK